ncbi:hypothetical protein Micbo1qcDRAFT_181372 [Microdochium bolleyi]|uniref:UvrD-like helicase ATP-binding domain-containing protein n=1 Tax=Microdochium bolleyi TaxID=196109 RepID=A0A136IIF1_9PEZI|nr:hypothetical protein Micbo1qcDRAFT_181372 [Microdochium bolleyi]
MRSTFLGAGNTSTDSYYGPKSNSPLSHALAPTTLSSQPGRARERQPQLSHRIGNPDKYVGVLTYSKRLQTETAKRLDKTKYPKSETYTFHGLGRDLFSKVLPNDREVGKVRSERAHPTWKGKPFDIIILDEMQDCTETLFWLVCTFVGCVTQSSGRAPRLVVLGDERQAIYEFKGADARYLSDAPTIMADLSSDPWDRLTLNKSFRLSHQNANFINKAFLEGEDYIVGSHDGPKPLYIHADVFKVNLLAEELVPLIRQYGVENTAILGISVRTNRRISKLTNHLTVKGDMSVAQPVLEDMALDDQVIHGKICVSTIHQFKGSERELVILYGLDDYYFKIAPDQPDDRCPNDIFVALSRSSRQLVVIHDVKQRIMPCVDVPQLRTTAEHQFLSPKASFETRAPTKKTKLGLHLPMVVGASDLARHVTDEALHAAVTRHATITKRSPALPLSEHIGAPDKIPTDTEKRHCEAVSDINGIAIVAAYELHIFGTLTTLDYDKEALSELKQKLPQRASKRAAWLCRDSCRYLSGLSGYRSREIQMNASMKEHKFKWLAPYLKKARARLEGQFQSVAQADLQFEYKLRTRFLVHEDNRDDRDNEDDQGDQGDEEDQNDIRRSLSTEIPGRADIIQTTPKGSSDKTCPQVVTLWEIKFVSHLSLEHVVQASVYAHLWATKHDGGMPKVMLYNVRDGEKWEISPKNPAAGMQPLVEEVLRAKYTSKGKISDEEFLNECAKIREEVEGLFGDSSLDRQPLR